MNKYELIKDMCPDYGTMCNKCNLNGSCSIEYIAESLINKNYHKIPEGSVVISKKELLDIASDYDKMAMFHLERQRELDQARKQVVKEVLKLLDEMRVEEDDRHQWRENHNDCIEKCKVKLAKEFRVEL